MYLSPEVHRLLEDIQHAHEQLISHFAAGEPERRGLRAVYEALEAALSDMDEQQLDTPIDGGWSAARVMVHLAEHDQGIEEAARRGVVHMIEHGLEHARSLWLARVPAQHEAERAGT